MCIPRAIFRFLLLLTVNFFFLLIGIGLKWVYKKNSRKKYKAVLLYKGYWARSFCRILNIQINIQGKLDPKPNALIVANHVGSPDIFILGSCFRAFFISKADVASWPLVGKLSCLGETIFVDRSRRQQVKQTIDDIAMRLKEGFSVAVFPEAQATEGFDVLPFKASHFQGAVLAERPVLPVMIRYLDRNQPSIACWAQTSFISHFFRLLQNPKLEVDVRILPALTAGEDRRALANESHLMIKKFYLNDLES